MINLESGLINCVSKHSKGLKNLRIIDNNLFIGYIINMKKRFIISVIILTAVLQTGVIIAGAYLSMFQGKTEGENVVLIWKTEKEENLQSFIIERKTVNGSFAPIGSVDAKGDNSLYSYTDENVYKTNGDFYIYRLKIVERNNDRLLSYSSEIKVSPNISSVKRTWGSIKAMFR